jgi:nucleoside-diphosphate-sugar epimerase
MSQYVVVGSGPIGTSTARHLAAAGHRVTLASRSGGAGLTQLPGQPAVTLARVDAMDADALTALATGAVSIVNAVNPRYTSWPRDWPPLAAAFLTAAQRSGAGLVTVGNLYGYGPVTAAMTEDQPLRPRGSKGAVRAEMWLAALAAHEAGRARCTELRASDYFGPGIAGDTSYLNRFVLRPALRGAPIRLLVGDPAAPHSWSFVDDIGALAARLAAGETSWGRVWHVPSTVRSVQQVAGDVAEYTGGRRSAVSRLPRIVFRSLATVVPVVGELRETAHQFEHPFVLDATHTETALGVAATPWPQALQRTCEWLGARAAGHDRVAAAPTARRPPR